MSTFEDREKMLIDKLSATDPLGQVAQVAKYLPQAEATKILRYATSSGDAPDVVAANLNAYDKDSIGSVDWENALKDAPMTKTFLSNPLPLAIIQNKDNAEVLAGVENENKVWSAFKDGWKDAARTTLRSVQGIFEATAAGAANEQKINDMPPEYQQWSQQGGSEMLKKLGEATKGLADAKVLQGKNLPADTVAGQYGLDVVRVIPQLITQMGAAVATGPLGAAGLMGAQIAGGDYEKYRKGEIDPATGKVKEGSVVDPGRAMGAALGDAALQAPLETIGLGKIMKAIPKGVPVKERVRRYIEAGATEGVTEWLQQYPQGAADIYAQNPNATPQEMTQKFVEDFWQNTREGLYQGAVAFPLGVFGGAVHNALQRQATVAYVDNIEAVQAKLAGSAILAQSPELVEQHLEAITGGEKAYIDPDALVLYQMENPKALEELGLTEQEVNAALQTGEMVEVSKARYVTAASVDPSLHDALKDDIAPSTDGLTLRRITDRKNDKDVKRATDKIVSEDKAFKEWSSEYSQQLKAAGIDGDMAKQVLVGLQAHARAMSDNPVEWLRQNAPEFRLDEGMQEGALAQREALYQKVKQSIGSAGTSLNQVAAIFKKNLLTPGTVNVDIGGGKYDLGTEHLKGLGIENLVYDPFNRDEAHNNAVIKRLQAGEVDSATVNNVLNVIKEPEVRAEVIRQAAKAIKSDGAAFFQIYEGSKTGEGRVSKTKDGVAESWQNNLPAKSYLEEVKHYFGDVKTKGNIIVAKNPVKTAEAAIWEMDGNPYFQYAGVKAQIADHLQLKAAQDRLAAGEDAEAVRKDTGWFKGMDGRMRFEIDDSKAVFNPEIEKAGLNVIDAIAGYQIAFGKDATVGDILHHPSLYAAYPDVAKLRLVAGNNFGEGASYDEKKGTISIDKGLARSNDSVLHSLLHEIQHAIQQREGFSRGGSPTLFEEKDISTEELSKINREIGKILTGNKEYADLYSELNQLNITEQSRPLTKEEEARQTALMEEIADKYSDLDNRVFELLCDKYRIKEDGATLSPFEQYQLIAGEIEARDTASRANLNEQQRRDTPPTLRDDAIIVWNGKEAAYIDNIAQEAYNIVKEANTLYVAAAEKFPELVADRKVKRRVENAIQQTLDFGSVEGDIISRKSAQVSLFSDGLTEGTGKGELPGREAAQVRNSKVKRSAKQLGLGVTRELVNEGAISLVGRKVSSVQELAEIAQVLRHPGYEKFHKVYTNDVGEIMHHETVSSMLPAESSLLSAEDKGSYIGMLTRIDRDITTLGATKFYIIHNHPSTNPTPSAEDIAVTKNIANTKFVGGTPAPMNTAFAGHIVLDTDKYCLIDREGKVRTGRIDEKYQIKMSDAAVPHIALGKSGFGGQQLASAIKQLADQSSTTAFFMTTKGEIRGIVQLPDAVAKMKPDRVIRYLRWLAKANYSNYCSITTSDQGTFDVFKNMVDNDQLLDVMLTTNERTVRQSQPEGKDWFGPPLGQPGKRLLETGEAYNNDPDVYMQAQQNMANGSIHWENGKAIITLMQTGNPSTVIHEMVGHFFFQNLVERSKQDGAPEQVIKDVRMLLDWAGYEGKDFDDLTKDQRTDLHEKVARAAESYVMTGKAPSVATQSLFRRFAEWMRQVYTSVRELGVQVTPEVSAVFDRMLATDAEISELEAVEQYHKSLPDTFLEQLTDKQRARLDRELANVRAEAEEKLRAKIMQDLRADNREAIAEERKAAQAQIRAELDTDPLYIARAAMQAPANTKAVLEAVNTRIEELISAQVDLLVNNAKLGVENKVPVLDDEGYMTGEWLAGFSNNQQWYKDLLASLPRQRLPQAWGNYIDWVKDGRPVEEGKKPRRMPPNMREAFRKIAIEHLEKGWYDELFGDIPANTEYLGLLRSSPTWDIVMDNGGGLKLNEEQTREMYPDKADKLPKNMFIKGGGFDADTIAQVFGFSSGDELLARIIDSPTLSEAVKERLQARMQQFRDLLENKEAMQEEARAAMYNDGSAALLAIEQQLIEEKAGKVKKAEEAQAAAAKARESAKLTAQRMLGRRPIIEATRLQSYVAAERRAAVDAAKFLQAKDYENAAAAKERQLINHALIQESLRIKREAERIKKYLNKQRKSKNWMSYTTDENGRLTKTSGFRDQAAAILARFGFVRKDAVAPEETLAEWVKRQEADEVNGGIINIADWIAYDTRHGTVSSLTLSELQDIENAIRNIKKMATIGADSDGFAFINSDGLEATANNLMFSSAHLTNKQVDKIEKEKTGWLKDMLAGMKQGHRLFEALDAFKSFGPWYQTFYESVKRAADYRSQLLQRVTDRLENAFASESIDKAERYRMAHKKIYVGEWEQSVTKNTLLAIALNMGNKGNIDRLISTPLVGIGMKAEWSLRSIKAVLEKHLTAADFRLVGKIWQAIDVYDEYNATVKRMTGTDLPKVEPQPIEFTVGGETIHLAGGYYPLSQDRRGSKQAELNAEKKLGDTPGVMPYPATGRSKARVSGSRYAVDTDLANLYSNMTDIAQDIAFRPVAHDLNKLMRDERVVGTIRDKLGDAEYKAVLEWQKRITSGRAENVKHPLDRFFTWARSATVISSLLLRPGVAVQNLANVLLYGNSMDGWTGQDTISAYMRHGWADYIPNALANSARAKELREYVYSKSVQMRDKKQAPDYSFREIYEAGDDNRLMHANSETVQEIGYKAAQAQESLTKFASDVFAWTDQLTDIPIWLGAYEKAIGEGKTETQAVSFADAIIRNSTGTGRNLDTSWMQASGSPAMRLFTMFQTFLNTAYNRWAAEAGIFLQDKDKARLIKFIAGQYIAFGILSAVLSFKTPDDDKEPWKWFVKEVLGWPLGMIPLFGGIAKTAIDSAMGFFTYGYTATPVESKARDVLKLLGTAQKVAQGQKGIGEIAEPAAASASFFLKYPDQLNDWFFNAYDVLSGNMQPELHDLVKRRPKKERE